MVDADATGLDPSRPRRLKYFCQLLNEQRWLDTDFRAPHKARIG